MHKYKIFQEDNYLQTKCTFSVCGQTYRYHVEPVVVREEITANCKDVVQLMKGIQFEETLCNIFTRLVSVIKK